MTNDLQKYQQRKKLADSLLIGGIVLVVAGFVLVFTLEEPFILGWLVLMAGFGMALLGEILFKVFQYDFKNRFLKQYINEGFDRVRYMPVRDRTSNKLRYVLLDLLKRKARYMPHGLRADEVEKTGFVPPADGGFFSSDYLEGTIGTVGFAASDVKTEKKIRHENNNKTTYQTLFHGRVFRFDFNKPLDGDVFVLERYTPYGKYGRKELEKVQMESIAFNKTFNVHTSKPQTAFYVLTPHFMERLEAIEKNHPGNIGFSFIGRALYFAIHTGRDTFAFRHFKKLDAQFLKSIHDDVNLLGELIDDLRLNDRIFLPEAPAKSSDAKTTLSDADIWQEHADNEPIPTDETWAQDLHPAEVARATLAAMKQRETETAKGKTVMVLEHTERSQAMYDTYVKSCDMADAKQFERLFTGLLKMEQTKIRAQHNFETMSGKKLGCLTVIGFIVFIILMFMFSDNCNVTVNGLIALSVPSIKETVAKALKHTLSK
ncbi:MAG: DUF3137 domain-containing protein [Acholeplasmatales bacterium]|nr:MAG: DUF3137 domain-containing protein [Acholeplasmatales bacterium]